MKYFSLFLFMVFAALPTFAQKEALEAYGQAKGKPHTLIDVRTAAEVSSEGMLRGAVHIPLDALGVRLMEIDKKAPVFVYCRSGSRSEQALSILKKKGYEAYNLGSYSNLLKNLP